VGCRPGAKSAVYNGLLRCCCREFASSVTRYNSVTELGDHNDAHEIEQTASADTAAHAVYT